MDGVKPALHFVGFADTTRYNNAVKVWGPPDFVHRTWDRRAKADIVPVFDKVVFAQYHDQEPCEFAWDDSNQPDDPAALERG